MAGGHEEAEAMEYRDPDTPSGTPIFLYRFLSAQIRNRRAIESQPRQNLFRVLSQHRRRPIDAGRRPAHVNGVAEELHFAHLGMLNFYGKAIGLHLRIGEHLVQTC